MTLRVLDMFSGIGGFSLGLERAGMKTVRFIEQNKFCQAVLEKHWPEVPCDEDVCTAEFTEGEADIICGGFPCQDVSLAGKRAGVTGERSGLYRELVRAIRLVRPRHAIMENVAALLGDGMGVVLGDVAEVGYNAEWDCVPACAIGAPHERDRVWIVAHANGLWGLQPKRSEQDERRWIGDRTENASDAESQQMGFAGQPRLDRSVEGKWTDTNPTSLRCGEGRPRRSPDSFARVREQARRHAAEPYSSRLAFREGIAGDAWEKLTPAERNAIRNERQSLWPDEPALSGVDDGVSDWMDRVKATGNALIPQIPEMIGKAIMDQVADE